MYKSNGKKAVATTTKYTAIIAIQSRKKDTQQLYVPRGQQCALFT